jgi:hypothetical protein
MKSNLIKPMFCQKCWKEHRPHIKDRFVLYSRTGLLVYDIDWNPPVMNWGFAPHLIEEYTEKDEKIILKTFCLIENCGIRIEPSKNNNFLIYLTIAKFVELLKKDWVALQKYTDNDYSLI